MITEVRPAEPVRAESCEQRWGRNILALLAALCLCLILFLAARGATKSRYYIPLGFLGVVAVAWLLPVKRRTGVALTLLSVAPAPWIGEVALEWLARSAARQRQQARGEYARNSGIVLDERTPAQVINDLRNGGQDAWPAAHPSVLLLPTVTGRESALRASNGKELLPLGGISNVTTEYGNEDGRYLIYQSDEHGFRNPSGIWSLPRIDVAVLGDSFTQGASVKDESTIAGIIRRNWAATLNLGYGGNGPLIELGALLEYLPQRRPRAVLWVLCEGNDLGQDLNKEMESPLLRNYWKLGRGLQNLEQRQREIDALLRTHIERTRRQRERPGSFETVMSAVELQRLHGQLYAMVKPPRDQWSTFEEILRTGRDTVRGWEGELYLVYLPIHYAVAENWLKTLHRGDAEWRRQRTLEIGRRLGIPVIDLEPEFLAAGSRVRSFKYPYPGHFTAAGYELAGQAVVRRLKEDGL